MLCSTYSVIRWLWKLQETPTMFYNLHANKHAHACIGNEDPILVEPTYLPIKRWLSSLLLKYCPSHPIGLQTRIEDRGIELYYTVCVWRACYAKKRTLNLEIGVSIGELDGLVLTAFLLVSKMSLVYFLTMLYLENGGHLPFSSYGHHHVNASSSSHTLQWMNEVRK